MESSEMRSSGWIEYSDPPHLISGDMEMHQLPSGAVRKEWDADCDCDMLKYVRKVGAGSYTVVNILRL